ncbi:MAG: hypothetical protein ACXVDN_25610 [Ktedonobacteraceae bacterium]
MPEMWTSTQEQAERQGVPLHEKTCHFTWHREGVGTYNIRQKYRGEFGVPHVVAEMAPATGIGHMPHTCVARL